MAEDALADTGAILSVLDRQERWHRACIETFPQFRLPLVTSQAVLTEVFHLVLRRGVELEAAWEFLHPARFVVSNISNSDLPDIQALMYKYRDRPMDFADATLVFLARREGLTTIFTVDHDDFETYRIDRHRRFRILPERGSTAPPARRTSRRR